jgi:hypothetical protein
MIMSGGLKPITDGPIMVSLRTGQALCCHGVKSAPFQTVKLFDLNQAAEFIQDDILPVARIHVSAVDGTAIWEVVVGLYDWLNAVEESGLHRWLRESGALDGERVLVKSDNVS